MTLPDPTAIASSTAPALPLRVRGLACVLVAVGVMCVASLASATAASAASPWWHLTSGARPTFLKPDGTGQLVVTASNLGDGAARGESSPIVFSDTLPEGLRATAVEAIAGSPSAANLGPVKCSHAHGLATCVFEHAVPSYHQIEIIIDVKVEGARTGELNLLAVSGGGAPSASISRPVTVSSEVTPFGMEDFELSNEEVGGSFDTQAGSHPFQTTFTTNVNQSVGEFNQAIHKPEAQPAGLAKDLNFKLPPGLLGNPTPFPQCSLGQFFHRPDPRCSSRTVLGVAMITFAEPGILGLEKVSVPVFNLEPAVGEPARFGFLVTPNNPVFIDSAVRSGEDYGIMGLVRNIPETAALISSEVVFWGVPGSPAHDASRGKGCLEGTGCQPLEENSPPPFFELPSSCSGPSQSSVEGDSWQAPSPSGVFPQLASFTMPALDGCNRLPFHPSIEVAPDSAEASRPTGLLVDVHNSQGESLNAEGLGDADVKDITVALPEGVAVDPSSGDGLAACSEGLAGFQGFRNLPSQPSVSTATFSPALPEPLLQGVNFCANASKIGEATIHTPLLPNPVKGFVYLATQNENPFGSLVAMYIVAEDPVSGVLIRLAGQVHLSETGQIVTTFESSPQAPFEDAELHFFGGERAPLTTPARCGAYTTTASFVPWSAEPGQPPAAASSTFDITSGPQGAPCPGVSLPFSPSLTGGAVNINAGAFSQLTTTIGREDGQQNLQTVQLHFPPGLSGLLTGVKLCPQAQANEGTCGAESLIGETTVSAGVGSDPVSVKGGRVYLTETYDGAPFGLSIVNPVKAGPFDLEHDTSNPANEPACDCVVVRAKIEVDPITAALTITTDPSGPHAIPHLIDGIPVQIKAVNVLINRPGFTFNPTNCDPFSITAAIGSDEGAGAPISTPFQVTNCANLKFAPKFAVSTSGKTSKANGASLHVKLTYPQGPAGTYANIARVKVDLPKQLPSQLKTLQKACTAAQFEANPAGCPAASMVGYAKAVTPLIPVPLEGPAIFVSHGNEAFPSLTMVLQGYGVKIDLVGSTFISKAGITSSTFKTVPDQPIGSFELTLPQGKYSALAANGNLCKTKLAMPTEFLAQNGAKINESTKISVTGCPKTKKAKHKAKKSGKAKGKK
jgi:hypothetical protein